MCHAAVSAELRVEDVGSRGLRIQNAIAHADVVRELATVTLCKRRFAFTGGYRGSLRTKRQRQAYVPRSSGRHVPLAHGIASAGSHAGRHACTPPPMLHVSGAVQLRSHVRRVSMISVGTQSGWRLITHA